MNIFRFILIPPTAVFIWVVTLLAGMISKGLVVRAFCEDRSGDVCFEQNWHFIDDALVTVFAGISAALIVIASSILAPYEKWKASLIVYLIGCFTALVMALRVGSAWNAFFGAIIFGALSLFLVHKYLTRR